MTRTSMGERDTATKDALKAEAERRARSGEPLSAIAKALDISSTTISRWAARGRFRLTDRRREAKGQPPLPTPRWARADYGRRQTQPPPSDWSHAPSPSSPHASTTPMPQTPLPDLKAETSLLAHEALALVRAGKLKSADDKLRAADRLLRIEKRLQLTTPSQEVSKVEIARARIEAMSDTELEDEIMRLAGMGGGDSSLA